MTARDTAPAFLKTFAPLPLLNVLFMKWALIFFFSSLETSKSPGPEALGSNFCLHWPLKYRALTRIAVAAAAVVSSTIAEILPRVLAETHEFIAFAPPSLRLLASALKGSRRER